MDLKENETTGIFTSLKKRDTVATENQGNRPERITIMTVYQFAVSNNALLKVMPSPEGLGLLCMRAYGVKRNWNTCS